MPRLTEPVDVRAEVVGLGVVGDDPDGDAAAVGVEQGVGESVVGDGEDADVGRPPRARQEPADRREAILTGAEVSLGPVSRVGRGCASFGSP